MAKSSGLVFEVQDDNSKKVMAESEEQAEKALIAVGLQWQKNVSKIIKQQDIIDTGRLMGSMSFAVGNESRKPGSTGANESGDFIKNSLNKKTLTTGTNVEYAAAVENGVPSMSRPGRPFLESSWTMYRSQYERLIREVLEGKL